MLLIPAIDLKDGKCVRLRQGRMEDETVFADDPLSVAQRWVDAGARRLHMVDLNGAFEGRPINAEPIRRIADTFPDLPIQIGGGIRSVETIEAYLDAGVQWCILGTKAVREPHFVSEACLAFPSHIIVGLDAKDGKVAVEGWSKLSRHDVTDMAQHFEDDGVDAIVYTDIGRDGMMTGCNVESTVALANAVRIPVIASGGIINLDDVRALCEADTDNIIGAITGRAIYEGTLDFEAGQRMADELTASSE